MLIPYFLQNKNLDRHYDSALHMKKNLEYTHPPNSSHEISYRKNNSYKCPNCEGGFSSESDLANHIQTVHEKRFKFDCYICDENCGTKKNMKNHFVKAHKGRVS